MLESRPFFSVCIPNYNYAHYLGETLDSVLGQSFQDFEVVIQDNASTDDSWDIITTYEKKDKRIKIFQNNYNIGFAPNLQKVTANAKGNYFILLSSDDIMFPNALQRYYEIIKKTGAEKVVLGANTAIINENSESYGQIIMNISNWRLEKSFKNPLIMESQEYSTISGHKFLADFVNNKSAFKAVGVFCATCYSRELWEEVEGYDQSVFFSPDTNFMVKILMKNPSYIWVHEFLFGYRVHSANNYGSLQKSYNLKNVTDKYIRTLNFGSEEYKVMKTNKIQLQRLFVHIICLKQSLQSWLRGNWQKSVQLQAYALATYPLVALAIPLFYLMLFLNSIGLILIPVLRLAIKFLSFFRKA